ncbi:unnamed protein product [Leptosia nina]|uniref:Uncharacterized protein n=1 Tax=Leptosia nina TaxID=320188 RepID=A0AAV1IYQ1_9NEOP
MCPSIGLWELKICGISEFPISVGGSGGGWWEVSGRGRGVQRRCLRRLQPAPEISDERRPSYEIIAPHSGE